MSGYDRGNYKPMENSQSESVRKVHKAPVRKDPQRTLARNDNLHMLHNIGFQSISSKARRESPVVRKEGKEERLTLRGSPSPLPESWSRREPPPGLGSMKSKPAIEVVSGTGCLSTSGSSAAWRPNSDAKGM